MPRSELRSSRNSLVRWRLDWLVSGPDMVTGIQFPPPPPALWKCSESNGLPRPVSQETPPISSWERWQKDFRGNIEIFGRGRAAAVVGGTKHCSRRSIIIRSAASRLPVTNPLSNKERAP